MDNSLPPFNVGDEVVCVDSCFENDGLIKDARYIVSRIFQCRKCKTWYVSVGLLTKTTRNEARCCGEVYEESFYTRTDILFDHKAFRRITPYQNSVSRSLAEQALKDSGDSRQDMKPERKEVEV